MGNLMSLKPSIYIEIFDLHYKVHVRRLLKDRKGTMLIVGGLLGALGALGVAALNVHKKQLKLLPTEKQITESASHTQSTASMENASDTQPTTMSITVEDHESLDKERAIEDLDVVVDKKHWNKKVTQQVKAELKKMAGKHGIEATADAENGKISLNGEAHKIHKSKPDLIHILKEHFSGADVDFEEYVHDAQHMHTAV